ncbi:ECF transporter S component [Raoultibacter phocaeensis]|uniref:ECF transporter S component n=1 Tax=Raoultibacter phocaeensis TaxID=2479841 RepID=UPI001118EBD3|nr:ECF transporter S component [Raoultibacter phocaeensis]
MSHLGKLTIRSPKQIAALVILVMMAMVLSFVEMPLIPQAPWLKYDPSGVIAALAALLYGPWVGSAVAVLAWIPRLVTDPLGAFMNILASVTLVIAMGSIYRRIPTLFGAVFATAVGIVCTTVVSIVLNFVVMPVYTEATFAEIVALIAPALLPFNVAKAFVNGGIALVAFRKLETLLAEGDSTPADATGEKTDGTERASVDDPAG